MSIPFRQDRSPVEKPGPASRTCRAWMPGKRQAGWPSLLVTFLWPRKRKVTRPPQEDETLLSSKATNPKQSIATEVAPTEHHAQGALLLQKRRRLQGEQQVQSKALGPCLRRDDEKWAFPRALTPHLNPLPAGERRQTQEAVNSIDPCEHPTLTSILSPQGEEANVESIFFNMLSVLRRQQLQRHHDRILTPIPRRVITRPPTYIGETHRFV